MADRPILFSAPMIRALLAGTKTQTRRVLCEADPTDDLPDGYRDFPPPFVALGVPAYVNQSCGNVFRFPRSHAIGDRLWVRETITRQETDQGVGYQTYAACGSEVRPLTRWYHQRKSIPSIHMPRWASRLTLSVIGVRVQRLQEICEADAMAEGIYRTDPTPEDIAAGCTPQDFVFQAPGVAQGWGMTKEERNRDQWWPNATGAFKLLWNSIHGPDAWDQNPWVAAYTFTVHRCNIDQMDT